MFEIKVAAPPHDGAAVRSVAGAARGRQSGRLGMGPSPPGDYCSSTVTELSGLG